MGDCQRQRVYLLASAVPMRRHLYERQLITVKCCGPLPMHPTGPVYPEHGLLDRMFRKSS
jgi:hypothetical protein